MLVVNAITRYDSPTTGKGKRGMKNQVLEKPE